jgi:hypothetical protein
MRTAVAAHATATSAMSRPKDHHASSVARAARDGGQVAHEKVPEIADLPAFEIWSPNSSIVDAPAFGDIERRVGRMEDVGHLRRLVALGAKRDHVLDVYVRGVADLHVVLPFSLENSIGRRSTPSCSPTISS